MTAGAPWLGCLAALLASASWAQVPRVAVHPLEVGGLSSTENEALKAFFDVSMARVKGIRLAGSSRVAEALAKPTGRGCNAEDSCLKFLATATDSTYALYAKLEPDRLGGELSVTTRVLRADGTVVAG